MDGAHRDPAAKATADARDDLPAGLGEGDVVADKYVVERVLGSGGMGVVVAARHLVLRRRVAIKALRRSVARRPGSIERFLREARAASSIENDHVARVSDVGTLADGTPFMVMEHLTGSDLADVLAARGALPVAEAVGYVLQACEAVAEAHRRGIVHRDLKPSNLFLARREGSARVKVLDFGVAKALATAPGDTSLTATGSIMGSPRYMSPEQVRNAKGVDHRADVWALGITLHELATGRTPFDDEHPSAVCAMIAADEPRLLLERVDGGPALEPIVRRCLEKDPASRFQDVGALVEALAPLAPMGAGDASLARIARATSDGLDEVATLPGPDEAEGAPAKTGTASSTVDPVVQRDEPARSPAAAGRPVRGAGAVTPPAPGRRTPVLVGGAAAVTIAAALLWTRGGESSGSGAVSASGGVATALGAAVNALPPSSARSEPAAQATSAPDATAAAPASPSARATTAPLTAPAPKLASTASKTPSTTPGSATPSPSAAGAAAAEHAPVRPAPIQGRPADPVAIQGRPAEPVAIQARPADPVAIQGRPADPVAIDAKRVLRDRK